MPEVASGADLLLTLDPGFAGTAAGGICGALPRSTGEPGPCVGSKHGCDLLKLRHRLEEGGRTVAEAAWRLGARTPEAERWKDLTRFEARALAALKRAGMIDPVQARLTAAKPASVPLQCFADRDARGAGPGTSCHHGAGEREAQGMTVDVLIHAGEAQADLFDAWGRPVPEAWV